MADNFTSEPQTVLRHTQPGAASLDASTTGRITIDPAAIVRNWQTLKASTAASCAAVVKADAYGCGLTTIGPALHRAGCDTFFVATAREGLALRQKLAGARIFVLNGVFDDVRTAKDANLIPFVSSLEALSEWPQDAPYALNVDTGMNRLGLAPAEAIGLGAKPCLLASHFACADTPSHPLNRAQEDRFAAVVAAYPGVPVSFANSAALLTRPATHFDLVRPGIALYGAQAAENVPPLECVVRLEAQVIQVRHARAGESVGYGGAERLARDTRLAIAALGYADGYLRASGHRDASAGAPVHVGGKTSRIVGRVSMDLIAIDVTDTTCERSDYIELFGPNVSIDDVARHAGTIGYELFTGLSRRADRIYGPL